MTVFIDGTRQRCRSVVYWKLPWVELAAAPTGIHPTKIWWSVKLVSQIGSPDALCVDMTRALCRGQQGTSDVAGLERPGSVDAPEVAPPLGSPIQFA
jgi:hypothetical protein